MRELRAFFPSAGWLLVTLQIGLPLAILLFGQKLLFKDKRPNTLLALLLVLFSGVPSLLHLPVSPYFVYQPLDRLSVLGSAVVAAAFGAVVAACLVFMRPNDRLSNMDTASKTDCVMFSRYLLMRRIVLGLLIIDMALIAVCPFRSLYARRSLDGSYADWAARELIRLMGDRTCLITNGLLDHHLLIQARLLGRSLTLIPMRSQTSPKEKDSIRAYIQNSPIFKTSNRQRLLNALSIGPTRFVIEWFGSDSNACQHAMVWGTPELWTACGYVPQPEGLAFGGLPKKSESDTQRLIAVNTSFADKAVRLFAQQKDESGYVAGLRAMLRTRAGFVANELGVLLEDSKNYEEAWSAYERASALDPFNVSALANRYLLTRTHNLHPEAQEALKKRLNKAMTAVQVYSPTDMMWVLENHGTIRQQAFYAQQSAMWANLGMPIIASEKRSKALSLPDRLNANTLLDAAAIYVQTGEYAKAEKCFRAVLQRDGSNQAALANLCTVLLGQKKHQEAEEVLRRANAAKIPPDTLLYQTIALTLVRNDHEKALALLKKATQDHPSDFRYWALLSDLLLVRGDVQLVERQLLPEMQAALKSPDHYMIHAIRGMAYHKKGPAHYKDARLALLNAVSRNAALTDLWTTILEIDMAIGNATLTEADVKRLLNIAPEHPLANYLLGALLLNKRQLSESEDFLRRSLDSKPTAAAYNDLAENLRLQKKLPEAEASVRQALQLAKDLDPAWDTLACVLCDSGRYDEALQAARTAVAAKPDQMGYQLTLLKTELGSGKRTDALTRLQVLDKARFPVPDEVRNALKAPPK